MIAPHCGQAISPGASLPLDTLSIGLLYCTQRSPPIGPATDSNARLRFTLDVLYYVHAYIERGRNETNDYSGRRGFAPRSTAARRAPGNDFYRSCPAGVA